MRVSYVADVIKHVLSCLTKDPLKNVENHEGVICG